jgi:hypothetical protein
MTWDNLIITTPRDTMKRPSVYVLFWLTITIHAAEHPQFNVADWISVFPYDSLFRNDFPKHFDTTPADSPLDLRKPSGTIISTPKDLVQTIQIREVVSKKHKLLETSKSDVFVWGAGAGPKPYLTKIGGIPYRPRELPWPNKKGQPYQFVFQIYFGDSKDIIKEPVPGDVMVVFGNGEDFWGGKQDDILIEWHKVDEKVTLFESKDVPKPSFYIPELYGCICRIPEYAQSMAAFDLEGHSESYLLDTVQATKIGTETRWIQGNEMKEGEHLLCVFSGPGMSRNPWPVVNVKDFPFDKDFKGYAGYQGKLCFELADAGCIYFIRDPKGGIRWEFQCY